MRLIKLVPDNTNILFLKWRTIAMGISFAMIIASFVLVATRGLNLGIDFVGGQAVQVEFDDVPPVDEVRERIAAIGLGDPTILQFANSNIVSIRTPLPDGGEEVANAAGTRLLAGIRAAYPDATPSAVQTVSGKVSNELLITGAWSLLLAMIGISIYIWFRFEWQFGIGALFALFHDVSLTFGFFALTQLEFDLNIVAALLTIIGYSLNDTIVVYDRIRENLKKYRKMQIVELLDLSVNETLSRTVMTNFFMLMALSALLILGPPVIFGFTAAMLLGIFIGTYSSIYMAAPLLVWLNVGPDSFVPRTAVGPNLAKGEPRGDGAVV
jgi:preprotein translocase subunit SecF